MHICKSDKNTCSIIPFLFLDHSSSWEEPLSTVKAESSSRPKKDKYLLKREAETFSKYQIKPVPYKTVHLLLNHDDENMHKYAPIHSQFSELSSKLLSSICT
jgi:hypothetical protein